jgi:uncharacterized membrane protein (Fun14 family)
MFAQIRIALIMIGCGCIAILALKMTNMIILDKKNLFELSKKFKNQAISGC